MKFRGTLFSPLLRGAFVAHSVSQASSMPFSRCFSMRITPNERTDLDMLIQLHISEK